MSICGIPDVTIAQRDEQQIKAANIGLLLAYENLKRGHAADDGDRSRRYRLAVRDPITELFACEYMEDIAGRLITLSTHNHVTKLRLLTLDIDRVNAINDKCSRLGGDVVSHRVGAIVAQTWQQGFVVINSRSFSLM